MTFRESAREKRRRMRRERRGRDVTDREEMQIGNFLLLLSEKQVMTKEDVFRFFEKNPPYLDEAASERFLQRLTQHGDLEFDGEVCAITEKGMKRVSVLKRISGYLDSLFLDPEKAPKNASEIGAISNSILACLAILVGILSRSLALSTEGADAGLDVLTSIVIWAGIRAGRERVSALFGSFAMTLSGAFLAYRSFNDIFMPGAIGFILPAMVVAIIVMVVDYVMMVYKHFVGKRTGTLSLVADAYHNKTDVIAAVGVLIGVLGSSLGFLILDPAVGIIVSLIIIINGVQLIRECIHSLSGKAVNWSRYSMRYEKALKLGRSRMTERALLEVLKDQDLTKEEILSSLQKGDPLSFIYAAEGKSGKSILYSPEYVAEVLDKLEREETIKRRDRKYSLAARQ